MRQILEEMDATELDSWAVYYSIEPWGERRADIRSAMLCNLIHNKDIPKEKAHKRTKLADWMLFEPKKEDKGMDTKELRNFFENLKLKQAARRKE